MDSNKAKTMMEALAELMDESHEKAESRGSGLYNEIRQLINNELMAAVEKIAYEKKYEVIDNANDLADSIGLYLNYPELQNKYVIGFYEPDEVQTKSIRTHYLCSSQNTQAGFGKNQDRGGGLSDTIPTIVTYGEGKGEIRALNLAERRIQLSSKSYGLLETGTDCGFDRNSDFLSLIFIRGTGESGGDYTAEEGRPAANIPQSAF